MTASSGETLLSADVLDRLERLQLASHRRLAGRFAGDHRSRREGSSLDFADYRTYHPGDDFRRIDYNLYARLDQLLLKLYEAEDEIEIHLLIDTSASMSFGDKLLYAKRLAAALGFVSLVRRDPVTVHTIPSEDSAARYTARGSVRDLFANLASLEASGPTPFAAAAARLIARPSLPGMTILISDLLTPEWEDGLRRLPARGGDLVVVHVLHPEEIEPPFVGDVDLRDTETGSVVAVSLSPQTAEQFRQRAREWRERIASIVRRAGATYVFASTDVEVETALFGTWERAGLLR